MTFKNFLSGVIGGFIGAILLSLFEYFNYLNLGYIGGYVILIILIFTVISALVIDFYWSQQSTFTSRTFIGFIAFLVSIFATSYSDFGTVSLGAIGIILFLGLGMSLIIAQIFKY